MYLFCLKRLYIFTENLCKIPSWKGVEKRPLDQLISQDLVLSVIKTPEYSSRVCTKCALKIRNAVELCRFVKDNLNPQPVPIEEDITCINENSDPYHEYWWKRLFGLKFDALFVDLSFSVGYSVAGLTEDSKIVRVRSRFLASRPRPFSSIPQLCVR